MSPDRSDAGCIELLLRLRAGPVAGFDTSDAGALSAALDRLLMGEEFEAAFGLENDWRSAAREIIRERLATTVAGDASVAEAARNLHFVLTRYRSTQFDRDLRDKGMGLRQPTGVDAAYFDVLVAEPGGEVPSVRTLKRRIEVAREFSTGVPNAPLHLAREDQHPESETTSGGR